MLINPINIRKTVRSIRFRWRRATRLPSLFPGTRYPFNYRIRRFLQTDFCLPSYVNTPSGARHYLSTDPTDDRVLEEMFGPGFHFFFPKFPDFIKDQLLKGGWILDVGAYNGFWGVELLMRYPSLQAIFIEPNPAKCENINKTITGSAVVSKARVVMAALAEFNGLAWLMKSEDGSWGDFLSHTAPAEQASSFKVFTTTLSKALNGVEPIVVKCNAEGGEFELVRQLLALEIRPKYLILMIHPEHGDADGLRQSLSNSGYTINVVKENSRRPIWHAYRIP